ncbi:MAG: hypothetical protein KIS61_12505 [Candidatus Eremiobacteraeota bacterium]|nr:hypothetical protein [Candidatus Eremiobacteraeota bacterium]
MMMYNASDNNLYAYQVNDLKEAQAAQVGDSVQLLATADHRPVGGLGQRLDLKRGEVKAQWSDLNMSDPKNLADFVEWGIKNYPAENYWLVLSDHGDAWKGALEDDHSQGWMSLPQLQGALAQAREKTGRKLDVLSFDCCYMGSLEAAHELRHEAGYMVASPEEVGYYGHDYTSLLPAIEGKNPRQLAEFLVESGSKYPEEFRTIAAYDLSRMEQVTWAVGQLGSSMAQEAPARLREAVGRTQIFGEYHDLGDLAEKLAEVRPALQPAAQAVKEALAQAVVAEAHRADYPGAHGLQIETRLDTEKAGYADTAFAKDSGWGQAIAHLRS